MKPKKLLYQTVGTVCHVETQLPHLKGNLC